MKFFSKLPKTTFSSTIGDFLISDFFTYLDYNRSNAQENSITVDDKTTLIEASYQMYQDVNNFWSFLPANDTINPFHLLVPNVSLFADDVSDKINLILVQSPGAVTGGSAFPIGSIIVPTTSNTGASYNLGYTGNFQVSGPFALIEQSSYYDGNMVIGSQVGGTGPFITVSGTAENVTVIQKNSDGTFSWAGTFYTGNKKAYSNKVVSQVLQKDAKSIDKETVSSNPTLDTYLPVSTPVSGITQTTSYSSLQIVKNSKKQINAVVPSMMGTLNTSFVTTKYN